MSLPSAFISAADTKSVPNWGHSSDISLDCINNQLKKTLINWRTVHNLLLLIAPEVSGYYKHCKTFRGRRFVMKSCYLYLVALMGLAVFLSACSGGLGQEPTDLMAQSVNSCDFQGRTGQYGNAVGGYMSATCLVKKDGKDYVKATAVLQKRAVNGLQTTNVRFRSSSIYYPRRYTYYTIKVDDLYLERNCSAGQSEFRVLMIITWSSTPTFQSGTNYSINDYSPWKRLPCGVVAGN